jgi:hypothetical protein
MRERFLHRGKKASSEDGFCKEKSKRRLLPTFLQKVKVSKGQQRKQTYDNFDTNLPIISLKQHQSQIT